jgi:hypothetical protein
MAEVFAAVERTVVARTAAHHPLARDAEALSLGESGTVTGKVVPTGGPSRPPCGNCRPDGQGRPVRYDTPVFDRSPALVGVDGRGLVGWGMEDGFDAGS